MNQIPRSGVSVPSESGAIQVVGSLILGTKALRNGKAPESNPKFCLIIHLDTTEAFQSQEL